MHWHVISVLLIVFTHDINTWINAREYIWDGAQKYDII